MASSPYVGLTPEVVAGLEISLVAFFDQWKQLLATTLEGVANLSRLISEFEREENEMMHRWEDDSGTVCTA